VPILVTYMLFSELEAVAEFAGDLAGIVEVEAAEGEAVVEQDAAIAYVGCGDGGGEFFGEGFADGEIEGGVLGQVGVGVGCSGVGVAVDEAGAVVDVGGGEGLPGESGVEAYVEGVALVVIDWSVAGGDVALG